MASEPNGMHENAPSSTSVENGQQLLIERTHDRNKTVRHPRWTRQETLFLIEGKKIAEDRGLKGRRSSSVFGSDQYEPKWDSVSSYCRQYGVNRGPVQCRKRWSNLVCDFRKIKMWESQLKGVNESFWTMRSDLRRDRRLPGFFDREVYDVLDGRTFTDDAYRLALVTVSPDEKNGDGIYGVEAEDEDEMVEDEEAEAVFNGSYHSIPEEGLFSEFEQVAQDENDESRGKEKAATDDRTKTIPSPVPISGTKRGKRPQPNFETGSTFQHGMKRRKLSSEGCQNIDAVDRLIRVLQRNAGLLNAQLEAQNMNCQVDRDQRNDQHNSLVTALNKITDALAKIADKL
ncbi:Homeodomain-like superfamily protein [Abeliophyllum distichum]|uniref:Homeodomain-like superfamily protein n=1 Tax=Abeliophyllum distichum TaxID=126358 RepID=A0ABD1VPV8_9LAMI